MVGSEGVTAVLPLVQRLQKTGEPDQQSGRDTRRDLFSSAAQRLHVFMLALRLDHEGVTCDTTPCVIGHNRSVQEKQVDSGLVIDGRSVCL